MADSSKNFITSEQLLAKQDVIAPDAKVIPHVTEIHNLELNDDYFWMRLSDAQKEAKTPDDQTQDVLDYLNAENDYKESALAPTKDFQSELFDEIVGRIVKDDESVPVFYRGYWYYSRYEEGKEYAFNCRKKDSLENPEEVLLDGPQLAEGHSYFAIGGSSISPNNNIIVYGIDTVSRRQYTLRFKDLTTGVVFEDEIPETTGGAVWANDNKTIFYTKKDPVTLRSYRILKHILGTDLSEDVVVYEETDDTFNIGVGKSKSERFIMIGANSTLSSETRYIDADKPNSEWTVIQERQDNHEYGVSHYGDHFYIQTNAEAKNFKLVKTSIETPSREHWVDVIPHRDDVLFEGTEIFEDFLVIEERKEGLTNIRVKSWDDSEDYYLEFNDPAYMAYVGTNPEFKSTTLRFGYTSLTTPNTTYEHSFDDKSRTQLKQQKVLGGDFDPANYASERIMVEARDGAQVPVSIVYRKGVKMDGSNPLLLYAYGSYGYSMDPGFSSTRLSLLDRGFVYAMAHIRGGSEMGRNWYEDGKLFKKMNTFNDFIDCGKHLVANNYTSPDHLYAMGGSAGGLLMGAVMNLEPELFNGIVAAVPFVDVINTMLDESIPLTTGEFDEWGNPKDKAYFDYMMSYSPYDNISKLNYPHTLITTGYWDSQVQYWEPAKWIAKLRDQKQDDNLLIMHCNMETGHGGASGRFARFKETAMEYAFLFMLEGIDK
ncbi:MAG: S9 family peptidase [Flavobacteriales bacterium]